MSAYCVFDYYFFLMLRLLFLQEQDCICMCIFPAVVLHDTGGTWTISQELLGCIMVLLLFFFLDAFMTNFYITFKKISGTEGSWRSISP